MKDIQNLRDDRRINIRKVGVRRISYPVTVLDKARRIQKTVATVNMYVNLPHRFKGTHMSRFIEILNRFHGEINLKSFHRILQEMKDRLNAEAAHMEIQFPYFLQRGQSPIGTERIECRMHGTLQETDDLVMEITVPVFSPTAVSRPGVLPGSLGRWGTVRVSVRFNRFIWIEDLIGLVEQGITADSDRPGSVEAMTRNLGRVIASDPAISWFNVVVENLAAGYATFASLEGGGRPGIEGKGKSARS
ncbi:MAG: GTP cyclohydrolase, FolE2/MptA family [Desulfobulbaceae bacterium]|jgi:GTP cyclohydrolase I|nr:GTP cyclohydrolase, FolE2/MptA family [Desulfobulbaceae bacterium]MDY0350897.1 GTP cyclohydrolase, FolE2/MptA family [Desulfobulbaceae bacterium]